MFALFFAPFCKTKTWTNVFIPKYPQLSQPPMNFHTLTTNGGLANAGGGDQNDWALDEKPAPQRGFDLKWVLTWDEG